jgi:hypothetical protein
MVEWLDNAGHRLHLPKFIQKKLCHWLDKSVGLYDDTDTILSLYGD